jgi:hypothetical protein
MTTGRGEQGRHGSRRDDPAPLVLAETGTEGTLDARAQVLAVDSAAAVRVTAGREMPGALVVQLIEKDHAGERAPLRLASTGHAVTRNSSAWTTCLSRTRALPATFWPDRRTSRPSPTDGLTEAPSSAATARPTIRPRAPASG